jgi:hypothetical protein
MGAMQTRDTCWFYSILNGFILSDEGKKILYGRLKEFYKKLTLNERAYFDDKFNAPCPMKNLVKTKEIYFWKFIDQYLCFLSGPRAVSLKAGKSASVLRNVSLQGSLAKQAQGAKGAFPQDEISKILDHVGFKGAYYIKYADSPQEFHTTRKPQFVVVSQSSASKTYMPKIPAGLMDDPNYELMCATLIVSNKIFAHAVAGFVCNRKGYIYDANQRKVFKCDWWNLSEFKKVVDEEVVKHYTKKFIYHQYAFAVFSRKEFTKGIAPACLMKYKTKTPQISGINFTDPNLGARLNNNKLFTHLKPAERIALKRKWARTEHRNVTYINSVTINALLNKATGVNNGYKNIMALKNAGYGLRNSDLDSFINKLEAKFKKAAPSKKYTFANIKAHLNQFTTRTAAVRKTEYSLAWKHVPMAQRKVLMHWRNKGEWLAKNAFENKVKPPIKRKPPSPSPQTKRTNKIRTNFNAYWSALQPSNRKMLRNYIATRKSPSPVKTTSVLNVAKRNVNALKTAKARKEYRLKRVVNMTKPNLMNLRRYINAKDAEARLAREAKSVKK